MMRRKRRAKKKRKNGERVGTKTTLLPHTHNTLPKLGPSSIISSPDFFHPPSGPSRWEREGRETSRRLVECLGGRVRGWRRAGKTGEIGRDQSWTTIEKKKHTRTILNKRTQTRNQAAAHVRHKLCVSTCQQPDFSC